MKRITQEDVVKELESVLDSLHIRLETALQDTAAAKENVPKPDDILLSTILEAYTLGLDHGSKVENPEELYQFLRHNFTNGLLNKNENNL